MNTSDLLPPVASIRRGALAMNGFPKKHVLGSEHQRDSQAKPTIATCWWRQP